VAPAIGFATAPQSAAVAPIVQHILDKHEDKLGLLLGWLAGFLLDFRELQDKRLKLCRISEEMSARREMAVAATS
jgi:hypothetical protein